MLSETLPPLILGALALMCLAFDNTHSRAAAVIASAALSVFATVTVKPPSSVLTTELSMADTNCTRWRRKTVPVWLIEKGAHAPGLVRLVCCAL